MQLRNVFPLVLAMSLAAASSTAAQSVDLEAAKQRYAKIVADELDRKILPGVSVAWVIDGQLMHAAGYGQADWMAGKTATADTIYRAGSISKLFNALAAMQMVEQGKLDLDAPIEKALPDFQIILPHGFTIPITARQLLCHRSGMIREAPVGGYLDASQPTIAATVASVANCVLVNPPNTKTRYSNVGPTIVGRAVEVLSGLDYADYQQQRILQPLGMTSSAWNMNDELRPRLAKGLMRVDRGGGSYEFEAAPEFELGTIPAGNLYTTAPDLARFAAFVMGPSTGNPSAGASQAPSSPANESSPLKRESLALMLRPQLTNEQTGYGLGFSAQRYRDHKTAQHSGAVYGFSTSLVVLPEARIATIVLSNADIASAPVKRLTDAALDLLLEVVRHEPAPPRPTFEERPLVELTEAVGEYESSTYWARLEIQDGHLHGSLSGQPIKLRGIAPLKFFIRGRLMSDSPLEFERDSSGKITAFNAAGQRFARVDPARVPAVPPGWQSLCGSYGERFIPLVISIRHGHLYAGVENEYDYRLTPLNRATFLLPTGMYAEEQVVFQLQSDGKVGSALFANMFLPRRDDAAR